MRLLLGLGIVIGMTGAAYSLSLDPSFCDNMTQEACSDAVAKVEIDGVYCQGVYISRNKPLYDLCRTREEWMHQLKKAEEQHCEGTGEQSKAICASLRKDIISEAVRRLNYLIDDNMEN